MNNVPYYTESCVKVGRRLNIYYRRAEALRTRTIPCVVFLFFCALLNGSVEALPGFDVVTGANSPHTGVYVSWGAILFRENANSRGIGRTESVRAYA